MSKSRNIAVNHLLHYLAAILALLTNFYYCLESNHLDKYNFIYKQHMKLIYTYCHEKFSFLPMGCSNEVHFCS